MMTHTYAAMPNKPQVTIVRPMLNQNFQETTIGVEPGEYSEEYCQQNSCRLILRIVSNTGLCVHLDINVLGRWHLLVRLWCWISNNENAVATRAGDATADHKSVNYSRVATVRAMRVNFRVYLRNRVPLLAAGDTEGANARMLSATMWTEHSISSI